VIEAGRWVIEWIAPVSNGYKEKGDLRLLKKGKKGESSASGGRSMCAEQSHGLPGRLEKRIHSPHVPEGGTSMGAAAGITKTIVGGWARQNGNIISDRSNRKRATCGNQNLVIIESVPSFESVIVKNVPADADGVGAVGMQRDELSQTTEDYLNR